MVEVVSNTFPSAYGPVTNIIWACEYLFSFKAERGTLDAKTKTFQTMVHSFKLNPAWFNKYVQVSEFMIQQQMQSIRNAGELSRIISQTNNEISDTIMRSYEERQKVNDRISQNFSDYIRGVDRYNNPFEQKEVELPSGYRHAWANRNGEYMVTDDALFNPNVHSTQDWVQLKQK